MKTLYFYISILLFAVISCDSGNEELIEKNNSYDLYISGKENNEACYWKNSMKTILPNGQNLNAKKVIIENSDVFVYGSDNYNNFYYWKNGVKTSVNTILGLQENTNSNIQLNAISGILYENGNVHIAGVIPNPNATSTADLYQFCYWKNGIKTILQNQTTIGEAGAGIYKFNNDIYIPAKRIISTFPTQNWEAGIFKNGQYNFVKNNVNFQATFTSSTGLKFLFTTGTDNYVSDISFNVTTLLTPFSPQFIKFLNSDNNDMYYVVNNGYYKNSNLTSLNGLNINAIEDFTTSNGNTFYLGLDDLVGNPTPKNKIFVNNIEIQSIPKSNVASFNSITVVQH